MRRNLDPEGRYPRRRRRKSALVSLINGLLTLVVLVLFVAVGGVIYGANQFYADGAVSADTRFAVEKGDSAMSVARRLAEKGLVSNPWIFWAGTRALKKDGQIKQGVYLLKAQDSMADVLTEITEGKPLDFFINVIPGETAFAVADELNRNADLGGDPVAVPPEGTLLAVRHDFFPGDTRESVIAKMQAEMQAAVAEIWAKRDPAIDAVIKSPAELVTLASIVEKETGLASERPQVAAVFLNRLKKGMRLQTDPTVIYGITSGREVLNRGPTSAELKAKTPYNTYQIDGLPPGPIANPGREALEAVANPAKTKDLYFVAKSANPADGHVFAETYAQHRKNVKAYRKAVDDAEAAREALEEAAAKAAGEGSN